MNYVMGKRSSFPLVAVLVLLTIAGSFIKDGFYQHIFILTIFYAAISSAWNIVGGLAGQLSLGHAAFFGIGAYTATLLYVRAGLSPWIGMIAAVALAVVVSALISYPSFKLRGPFFAMATLAFGEVIRILAIYFRQVTNGSGGISIPFKPSLLNLMFENKLGYVYFAILYLALVLGIVWHIRRSRIGYYLSAIRENEDAAQAIGISTSFYKLYASLISAGLTSIGGVFYTLYILYIEPYGVFDLGFSIQLTLVTIIGGIGTLWGPVVGAFLITPLNEFLRAWLGASAQGLHLVIYGLIMIVIVILLPGGLVDGFNRSVRAFRKKARRTNPDQSVNKEGGSRHAG